MKGCGAYTLEDEAAWEHAKLIANREYPAATGSNYWQVVTGIYVTMLDRGTNPPHAAHDSIWRMIR